jgi:hypothetical protein
MRAMGLDVPVVDELTSLVGEASSIGTPPNLEFVGVQCAKAFPPSRDGDDGPVLRGRGIIIIDQEIRSTLELHVLDL